MDERARTVLDERATIAKLDTMRRQVLLCTAVDCDAAGDPASALKALRHAVAANGLRREVLVTEASCLEVCEEGPICVVQPDGTWYAQVDEDAATAIVTQHLVTGEPVAEHLFLTNPLS